MNGQPPQPPPPPEHVAITFVGPITNPAVKNLRSVCNLAVNGKAKEITILFSSGGGAVDEGFALHNYLRALPVKLTMHGIGVVDSIAMVAFLAGEQRFCCSDCTFLFHDFAWAPQGQVNISRLQFDEFVKGFDGFKKRSEMLLKNRATFTDADIAGLKLYDKGVSYDAQFAKDKGIVHDIKQAVIPGGVPIYNVEV